MEDLVGGAGVAADGGGRRQESVVQLVEAVLVLSHRLEDLTPDTGIGVARTSQENC